MENKLQIKRALISVYDKDDLIPILTLLTKHNIEIISSSGTSKFIKANGFKVTEIEDITKNPSILGGRVKTLHPKIFGPILARKNNPRDQNDLINTNASHIDLVIVDLYPFEKTIQDGGSHDEIIEQIDIGGQSLIRAAAKNYANVLIVPSKEQYKQLEDILKKDCFTNINQRMELAGQAFEVAKNYDIAIDGYFKTLTQINTNDNIINKTKNYISKNFTPKHLRYGENPDQAAAFYSDNSTDSLINQINGKELSYNNLLDVDSALNLINEFDDSKEAIFAVIKHTNACGIAQCKDILVAFDKALEADPISAFGGVFITNRTVEIEIAEKLNKLFFEVILAPSFSQETINLFKGKKNRILITYKEPLKFNGYQIKNLLNGIAIQQQQNIKPNKDNMVAVTNKIPDELGYTDLTFALKVVKHLKSNAIAIVKNKMLIGSGTGQTSRVDALKQAIEKAKTFKLDLKDAVLASDGFFPFPDSIEISKEAGIINIAQPGGSIRDKEVIQACNNNNIAMVFTNTRYFKH
ncbi:MAG: bifunctional phosphoribosylaminoimidazolecarboxamide formyltransferase/IMP cyclohydrolase [Solitalea-like symbiont of Tyrophagus putrescentiae]